MANIVIVTALIVCIALLIAGSVISNGKAMFNEGSYMTSENLALGAKVTGDALYKGSLVDGKNATSMAFSKKNNAEVTIDLGDIKSINSIILKEDGLNAKDYQIFESKDNKQFNLLHAGDKIEYHRLCTFDNVDTRFLKLVIVNADSPVSLKEFEVFGEAARKSDNFIVSAYFVINDKIDKIIEDSNLTDEEKVNAVADYLAEYNYKNVTNVQLFVRSGYTAEGEFYITDSKGEKNDSYLHFITDAMKKLNQNVKMTIGISSGSGNQTFLTAISTNKDIFIEIIVAFCKKNNLDGVDFDYEFPQTKSDFENFDKFLIEIKAAMVKNLKSDAVLACAFGTRDIKYSTQAIEAIDFVNCMTYDIFDQDGYHSSFWGGCAQGGTYLESVGFKKEQIVLGIPFYGTQIDALMEQYLYKNLKDYDYYKNVYQVTDYLGEPTLAYFNSPSMVRDKTAFALLAGYGGVMTWHSTCDLELNDEFSLWRALNTCLEQFGGASND